MCTCNNSIYLVIICPHIILAFFPILVLMITVEYALFWIQRRETIIQKCLHILRPPVSSVAQFCLTLWDPMDCPCQASLSITNSRSFLRLMSIESVMPSNHLIFCHSLLLLPSTFPSIRVFLNESALCIRWPKHWSFIFISPSNEYSGLISFRMDWVDLLTVQDTLKSLP